MPASPTDHGDDDLAALKAQVQRLQDLDEIRQLKSRDFNFLDSQNWEGLAETVLAEDIYFEMFGKGRTGVTRVLSFISKSLEGASTVHHGHNEEIVLTGPHTATGVWRLEDHTKMPPGSQIPDFDDCGQYRDEYIRTEQGWRIHRSVLTFP